MMVHYLDAVIAFLAMRSFGGAKYLASIAVVFVVLKKGVVCIGEFEDLSSGNYSRVSESGHNKEEDRRQI